MSQSRAAFDHPLSGRGTERGVALALVLFALVIMGALISGAVMVGRIDRAATAGSVWATEAQNAAEGGLALALATWDPMVHNQLPVWDGTPATEWSAGVRQVAGNPLLVQVDSIRRLNADLFLVRSTGRRLGQGGQVLAELGVGQLLRLVSPSVGVNAALTVRGPVAFAGNAFRVSGINTWPEQWGGGECAPLDDAGADDVVGVRSATGTGVLPTHHENVFGFPVRDVGFDPTVTSATFQNFVDLTYASLAAQPGVKVLANSTPYNGLTPSYAAGGGCDRAAPGNLGEPLRNPPAAAAVTACTGYFPVVHGTASQTVLGGGSRGQGTLLIDGDLRLTGAVRWAGLVIVRGRVRISGTGNQIFGAVLAEGADFESGAVAGNVQLHYSACAVAQAIGGASLARPLAHRSWFQLF